MLSYGRFRIITVMIIWFTIVFSVVALYLAEQRFRYDLETRLIQINTDNANLTRALSEQVRRAFGEADNILLFMKAEYETYGSLHPETLALMKTLQSGRMINQIALADAQGNLAYSAAPLGSPIRITNREHFQAQKNSVAAGLYIALPVVSLTTGQPSIFLSRRLIDNRGNFAGTVSVGLDPEYFSRFFEQMELGQGSSILITRKDGAALAWASRQPVLLDPRGIHNHEIFQDINRGLHEGVFESPGFFSSVPNLGAYRVLDEYSLVVVVSTIKDAMLQDVYARRTTYYLWAATLIGLVMLFSYALWRQFDRLHQKEISLQATERDYQHLLENMSDGYYRTDSTGRIVMANPSMTRMLEYISQEEVIGKLVHSLWFNAISGANYLARLQDKGFVADFSLDLRKKSGRPIPVSVSSHHYYDENEQPLGTEGIVRDISERQKTEEQLKHLSYHDNLTDLYNRAFLNQYLKDFEAHPAGGLGLIIIDVDGLKVVNDTLGHETGDGLLVYTAEVLRRNFLTQVIARIGGDEFAVVLPDIDEDRLEEEVDGLRASVDAANYAADGGVLPLQLSIGYALDPGPDYNMRSLFSTADRMMYREKLRQATGRRGTIIKSLKEMLSARDYITEGHASRMQNFAVALAHKANLHSGQLSDIDLFAQFHDIGKVGVPDRILNKPGPLSGEERKIMQLHAEIGHRIATASDELAPIADWILKHHERWDGKGYPLGLAGDAIPLECRILAIVDAYDAMTNDRPYRRAMTPAEAVDELKLGAGSQFDPELVARFMEVLDMTVESVAPAASEPHPRPVTLVNRNVI
ncbi:MAG: diguanylate cyclase [Negativicutes bacterium]|nr:diguanylate cyclase [Negativicutes bacterium]